MTASIKHDIDVESEDQIEKHIESIKNVFGYKENIRLVYNGRTLGHQDTFSKYNVHDGDAIICLPCKNNNATTSAAAAVSSATATTVENTSNVASSIAPASVRLEAILARSTTPLLDLSLLAIRCHRKLA